MAPGPRAQPLAPARALVATLAGGLPLLFASATAGSEPGWGGQARVLGGALALSAEASPLGGWWWRLGLCLPLGPLSLRAALIGGLTLALALAALALAVSAVAHAQGARAETAASLGVASAWLLAATPALWPLAIAPDAGVLSLLLTAVVMERLCALELSAPSFDLRPLYTVGALCGLALAHDPRLGLALGVAAAPAAMRLARAGARGALPTALACALPGAAAAAIGWLSGPQGAALEAQPLPPALLGALVPAAGTGAILLFVTRRRRVLASALALTGALALAAGAGGSTRVLLAPLALLAAGAPAWLLASEGRSALRSMVAVALAALALLWLRQTSLSEPPPTDAAHRLLARGALYDVAPQTLLLSGGGLAPLLWAVELEQGARPDVLVLSLDALGDTEQVRRTTVAHPELAPFLREYVLQGHLSPVDLQSLAAQRPLALELSDATDPALYPTLAPEGLLHAVLPSEATPSDVRLGAKSEDAFHTELDAALASGEPTPALRHWLAGAYRGSALYLMVARQHEPASRALDRAEAIDSRSADYGDMRRALGDADTGPIDITPWLRK